jgi:hypothetical protein
VRSPVDRHSVMRLARTRSSLGSASSRQPTDAETIMRFAAYSKCGDVTATVFAALALTRSRPDTVLKGLAESAGFHLQGIYPRSCGSG